MKPSVDVGGCEDHLRHEAQIHIPMCLIEQQITLCESEEGRVSWCKCCKMYSLAYRSSCVVFDKKEYGQFLLLLQSLQLQDFRYHLSGEDQVLIKNPAAKIGFCLTRPEVSELIQMMEAAFSISEAFQIIYK